MSFKIDVDNGLNNSLNNSISTFIKIYYQDEHDFLLKFVPNEKHPVNIDFKDDSQMYMRHLDIVKKEHKLRGFDTMSPNGETKLLVYIEAWLSNMPENELKDFYVDKVLKGDIPYYE
jgi:hypothetical protein